MKHRPWTAKIEHSVIELDCTEIVLPVVEEIREEREKKTNQAITTSQRRRKPASTQ